jgi:hypothetical protein
MYEELFAKAGDGREVRVKLEVRRYGSSVRAEEADVSIPMRSGLEDSTIRRWGWSLSPVFQQNQRTIESTNTRCRKPEVCPERERRLL